MKLFVKEKILSFHNRYYIYNENDEIVYEIESKVLTIGEKTTIYDKNKNEIAYIERELFHFMPVYNIYINGNFKYSIEKIFKWFKNDYKLSNNYIVEGSTFNYNFTIKNNNGVIIALIDRELFTVGDQYYINIYNDDDINTILTIIVAITNDVDRSQRSNSH